ncbi:MAG: ComEC/Rec2 family competence protein [Nesterenkonia sp.]|nr:ComEC/Rec2 family competence protein [Nesterenkonia sp.]
MSRASPPLDLRLLPTAVCAWGASLLVVRVSGPTGITLGVAAGMLALVIGGVLAVGALLRTGRFGGRFGGVLLHAGLCAAAVSAASLQAGAELSGRDETGWTHAVESDRPVEVQVRVTSDPVVAQRRGFDGQPRLIAEAEVLRAALPDPAAAHRGRSMVDDLSVDVVLIMEVPVEEVAVTGEGPDAEDIGEVLRAGHRYEGLVRATPSEAGERAAALLFPFGDEPLTRTPSDDWTDFTEVFNGMRTATAEASSAAVGDGPTLLPGLILGDRSLQSPELGEAMRLSGLSHLTAVSGANCALVLGALLGLLRLMRAPRWTSVPVSLLGLGLFVMLVQPEPSVIRAAVMGSIGAMALFAGRGRASFSLLCVCVVLLLVVDPWFAVEPEFQLSVASTAGIVVIGTPIRRLLERRMPSLVAAPLALAFSAQLFVTPVLLPLSEGVNTYAVPANMLAAPLVPLITVPGTFAAVISTTAPWLATAVLWCSGLAAAGIGAVGRATSQLPQALAPWPEGGAGVGLVVLYVGACLVIAHHLVGRSVPREAADAVEASAAPTPRPHWAAVRIVVVAAAAGAVLALVVPSTGLIGGTSGHQWRIALCDVGQADMLVVRTGERSGIVIDAGQDPHLAHDCLRSLGVRSVETLMLTHEHQDHVGGVSGVLRGREVDEVLHAGSAEWDPAEELDLGDEADGSSDLRIRRAAVGDSDRLTAAGGEQGERGVAWRVWRADAHHPDPNDNSLVVLFELWEGTPAGDGDAEAAGVAVGGEADPLRMLVTGDLEEEQTRAALSAGRMPHHVDVLSVAHHGAANGGTELLAAVRPDVALIGVGEDNMYGHPAPEITDKLDAVGAAVYRTDRHGTVVLSIDDQGLRAEAPAR